MNYVLYYFNKNHYKDNPNMLDVQDFIFYTTQYKEMTR